MKTVTIEPNDKEYKEIARKAKIYEVSEANYIKGRFIMKMDDKYSFLDDIIDDKIYSSDDEDDIGAIGEEINDFVDMKVEEAIEYYTKKRCEN